MAALELIDFPIWVQLAHPCSSFIRRLIPLRVAHPPPWPCSPNPFVHARLHRGNVSRRL